MDMKEMVAKVKKGEPLYGVSSLSPYMQGVASRNSRYSGVFLHIMPWFNFVHHNQVSTNLQDEQTKRGRRRRKQRAWGTRIWRRRAGLRGWGLTHSSTVSTQPSTTHKPRESWQPRPPLRTKSSEHKTEVVCWVCWDEGDIGKPSGKGEGEGEGDCTYPIDEFFSLNCLLFGISFPFRFAAVSKYVYRRTVGHKR